MIPLSVITINFNNKQGLAETFASVFAQSYTGFEYIVIDGGSTDGSAELIEQHAGKISYRVSEKDGGIYDAMNKGIAAASGRYLNFLNSGDAYNGPSALEQSMEHAARFPGAGILYADIYMVRSSDPEPELFTHPPVLRLKYFKKEVLNQQSALISAALFREFGNFPLQYRIAGDYWLYLRSFVAGKSFVHMNFIMVRYDFSGLSLTGWETYIAEMDSIWKELAPKWQRRIIDTAEAVKKSVIGKIFKHAQARWNSVFS